MAVKYDLGNPGHMKPILLELCRLLSRFTEPDHRWLVGHIPIDRTGVFIKQAPNAPYVYNFIFFTPDDIVVRAEFNMKEAYVDKKTFENKVIAMLADVSKYLVAKREPLSVVDGMVVEALVEQQMARKNDEVFH